MSKAEYLLGWAEFSLLLGSAALVAAGAARRLPHLDRLERAVAMILVGTIACSAIAVVPLALGVLSEATLLLSAGVAAAVGVWLLRGASAQPRPAARDVSPSSRAQWVICWVIAVPVVIGFLASLYAWRSRVGAGVDVSTFHLPNVARWLQSGSLWQIDQFVPLQAHGNYPQTGDTLYILALLPFDNDFLFRFFPAALFVASPICLTTAAREFGAPVAPAATIALGFLLMPAVGETALSSGLPDCAVLVGLASGALFLGRHARTRRASDLALGAMGLGLAFGTKWYGVSAVVAIVAVLAGLRLLPPGRLQRLGRVVRETALLTAGILLVGGIWLLRNWVESDNPMFPLKVAPLGITIFDAPRDLIREQVGFSLAHYWDQPDIFFGTLPKEYLIGAGGLPIVLVAGLLLAAVLLARHWDPRVACVAVLGIVLTFVYLVTPLTALGLENHPTEARYNVRYHLPALLCLALVAAWVCGRLPRRWALALQAVAAAAAVVKIGDAYEEVGRKDVLAALGVVVATLVAMLALRAVRTGSLRRPAYAAAAAIAALVVLAGGWKVQGALNVTRYSSDGDAVVARLSQITVAEPRSLRISVAGDWNGKASPPIWPAFGPTWRNHVQAVGTFVRGFLTIPKTYSAFHAQVEGQRPDLLVVGRGIAPDPAKPAREEAFARRDGWREIAQSERLVLYTRSAVGA